MRRTFQALVGLLVGACLALLLAAPAGAQTYPYGGGGGTPPPPGPPEGCPVAEPPPGDPPPCHPRERASVSDDTVTPGQEIVVSTPPVFAPNTPVNIQMVRVNRNGAPVDLGEFRTDSSGQVSAEVTIPDAPRGVYFIYVVGMDELGNEVVALTPIVVRPAAGGSMAVVRQASVGGDEVLSVPAAVAEIRQDLPAAAEAAVVDAVTEGSGGLLLAPSGELQVRTPQGTRSASQLPDTGEDIASQVTAGSALLLAGAGLVLLRRRRSARA